MTTDDHSHNGASVASHTSAGRLTAPAQRRRRLAFHGIFKGPLRPADHRRADEIANELESLLHPYLKERLVARCHRWGRRAEEIRTAALEVEAEVERNAEADAGRRAWDAAGGRQRGVAGLGIR